MDSDRAPDKANDTGDDRRERRDEPPGPLPPQSSFPRENTSSGMVPPSAITDHTFLPASGSLRPERRVVVQMPPEILADIVLALWRIRQKVLDPVSGAPLEEMRSVYRSVERAMGELEDIGIHVRDHTGEPYVAGMALRVLAFQPSPDVKSDVITETLKPSIYLREHLIAMGEVVVSTP